MLGFSTQDNHNQEMTTSGSEISAQGRLQLMSSLIRLMMSSLLHRNYNISDISERFIPSLMHNQFRYYEINNKPVGFVNWAWLTDEIEQKFITRKYSLNNHEWRGGKNLWFPEFIAPYGHAYFIIRDLRDNIFPKGTSAKFLRLRPDGSFKSISHWKI